MTPLGEAGANQKIARVKLSGDVDTMFLTGEDPIVNRKHCLEWI